MLVKESFIARRSLTATSNRWGDGGDEEDDAGDVYERDAEDGPVEDGEKEDDACDGNAEDGSVEDGEKEDDACDGNAENGSVEDGEKEDDACDGNAEDGSVEDGEKEDDACDGNAEDGSVEDEKDAGEDVVVEDAGEDVVVEDAVEDVEDQNHDRNHQSHHLEVRKCDDSVCTTWQGTKVKRLIIFELSVSIKHRQGITNRCFSTSLFHLNKSYCMVLGPVCNSPLEIIFVLDGSGSIEALGRGNFGRCLNFIVQVEQSFVISPSKTRIAVVLFSNRARIVFSLDTYRSLSSVVSATKRIRYPRGGTKLGSALRLVQNNVMQKARKGVAKVSRCFCDLEGS